MNIQHIIRHLQILALGFVFVVVGWCSVQPIMVQAATQLDKPGNLKIKQLIDKQRIQVSWATVSDTREYKLQVRQDGETIVSKTITVDTGDDKAKGKFPETKLHHGSDYTIRVKAIGDGTTTENSEWKKKSYTFQDQDFDNDAIANDDDSDDDNDGTPDSQDEFPTDHDNDGTPDYDDTDDDNDLISDTNDDQAYDHDNDGTTDLSDTDDDNDGILDSAESPEQQFDEDNDGISDDEDQDYIDENFPATTYTINITSSGFSENNLTLFKGDSVQWVAQDVSAEISEVNEKFESSPPLEPGEQFIHTFNDTGNFSVVNTLRPTDTFTMTITVGAH